MNRPDPAPLQAPGSPAAGHAWWRLGQRRKFLVDRRGQLRSAAIVAGVVAVVLTILLVNLHLSRKWEREAWIVQVPELAETLAAQGRTELALQLAGAIVLLAMVVLVTVLETHKTAGAAFNLCRRMERLRDGAHATRVTLRRGDNLQQLGRAFNEMSVALDERLWQDIETFDDLSRQALEISTPEQAKQLAATLSELAATRRRMVGLPEETAATPLEVATSDHDRVTVGAP